MHPNEYVRSDWHSQNVTPLTLALSLSDGIVLLSDRVISLREYLQGAIQGCYIAGNFLVGPKLVLKHKRCGESYIFKKFKNYYTWCTNVDELCIRSCRNHHLPTSLVWKLAQSCH